MTALADARPRFSGHETFACRFSWIPKAVTLLIRDSTALSADEEAMSTLGLGKNMVKALRFWLEVFDVATVERGHWKLTPFGRVVFGTSGYDRYLERVETQWLLQWKVTAQSQRPLFVWRHVFFRRHRADFTRAEVLGELRRESRLAGYEHSDVTLKQHLDVFLHSYVSTAREGAPEDALDGPLIDLSLINPAGRRISDDGRPEPVYVLTARGRAPVPVVEYAILEFWHFRRKDETMVTLHDLAFAEGSPGATLRIPEDELRAHVLQSENYSVRISAGAGALHRETTCVGGRLKDVYPRRRP
ncbi:MAG: DUF4007 family protein [Thiohalocapsa sp.]